VGGLPGEEERVEALALVFGLFLTLFASLYLSTDLANPGAFSQPIDKLAGIDFSVTIMATVGFGDIAPSAPPLAFWSPSRWCWT
jgi:formate-dependent nitrite reductase membrane component NrfD